MPYKIVDLCALCPAPGFERPHMGTITLSTIFLSVEGEIKNMVEKLSKVREKMMGRVDEW